MDRYTKAVLTVIAASFAVLAWRAIDPAPVPVQLRSCGQAIAFRSGCPEIRLAIDASLRTDSGQELVLGLTRPSGSGAGGIPVTIYNGSTRGIPVQLSGIE